MATRGTKLAKAYYDRASGFTGARELAQQRGVKVEEARAFLRNQAVANCTAVPAR